MEMHWIYDNSYIYIVQFQTKGNNYQIKGKHKPINLSCEYDKDLYSFDKVVSVYCSNDLLCKLNSKSILDLYIGM